MGAAKSVDAKTTASPWTGNDGEGGCEDTDLVVNRISEPAEVLTRDLSSKIELHVRCEDLPKATKDLFIVLYSKWTQESTWTQVGITEVIADKTRFPNFTHIFNVVFRVEMQRQLRFELFHAREKQWLDSLSLQKFMGACEMLLVDVMMARSDGDGWLVKKLESHVPRPGKPPLGRLAVYTEEDVSSKQNVSWDMRGKDIISTDPWKRKADPYCIINRTKNAKPKKEASADPDLDLDHGEEEELAEIELEMTRVFRTEVSRRTSEPSWKRFELSVPQLCHSNPDQEIIIMVYDWFRVQEHKYIGECVLTYKELLKAFRDTKPIELPICARDGGEFGERLAGHATESGRTKSKGSRMSSRSPDGSTPGSRSRTSSHDRGSSHDRRSRSSTAERAVSKLSRVSEATMSVISGLSGRRSSRVSSHSKHTQETSGTSAKSSGSGGSGGSSAKSSKDKGHFGTLMGHLYLENVGMMRRYSFLDYLRGGLELKLAVAIDFTRSNATDTGGGEEDSYHKDKPQAPSAYVTAIRQVGAIMKSYDADDSYPVYGFGARLPPSHTITSDCFALTGDFFDPEVKGVDNVINTYQRALEVVKLHGPTRLQPVIRHMVNMARSYIETSKPEIVLEGEPIDQEYFVLLILTDGKIDDKEETIREVADAGHWPVSIIIVGIGNGDFTFIDDLANNLNELNHRRKRSEMRASKVSQMDDDDDAIEMTEHRDVVHFVKYEDFRSKPHEIGSACLAELPREVVAYYNQRNIKPNRLEKYEDKEGNPKPIEAPKHKEAHGRAVSTISGTGSQAGRNASKLSGTGRASTMLSHTSGNSNSRTASKISVKDGPERPTGHAAVKKKKNSSEAFIIKERERLKSEAAGLGYEPSTIGHGFREGLPSSAVDILVDTIVNGGHGKSPCFREMAKAVQHREIFHVPGQLATRSSKTLSHKPETDTEAGSTSALRRLASASKGLSSEDQEHFTLPSRGPSLSRGGTKDHQGRRTASLDSAVAGGAEVETAARALLGQGGDERTGSYSRAATKDGDGGLPSDDGAATGEPQPTVSRRTKSILQRGDRSSKERTKSKDDRGIRFDLSRSSPAGGGRGSETGGLLNGPDDDD